jgi:alkylation response protein AidB-like acyl-CoA dehydrogenase
VGVTGQKVWNSGADEARRGLLLARTDVDVPKREGITMFVIDMDQPGVETRPLRQMNGESHFCEVFLTEARVRDSDIVGGLDQGWSVARTTLVWERETAASRPARGLVFVPSGAKTGYLDRVVGDVLATSGKRPKTFSGSAVPARRLIELARERGVTRDPLMRQALARYYTLTEVNRLSGLRARASAKLGRAPGPEASISKLALARICHTSRDLSFSILGAAAMLDGHAAHDGELHAWAVGPGDIGAAPTSQRNTIGERVRPAASLTSTRASFRDLRVHQAARRRLLQLRPVSVQYPRGGGARACRPRAAGAGSRPSAAL